MSGKNGNSNYYNAFSRKKNCFYENGMFAMIVILELPGLE